MASLLDLLPKGGSSIVDSLANETRFFRRILFLIQEAEEGLKHFLDGHLSHFDPHVGDTACQIRAYYFALLWTKREEIFPLLEHDLVQLKTYAEKIMVAIDQGSRNLHRSLRPCILSEFLEKLSIDLSISEMGITLTIAHLLSEYRWVDEEGISQRIDEQKLQRAVFEEKRFPLESGRHWQQKFAKDSVKFILDLIENQQAEMHSHSALALSLLRADSYGRVQLPCLMSFEVIIRALELNKKIAMAWVIDWPETLIPKIHLIFQVNSQGDWRLEALNKLDSETPLFILRNLTQLMLLEEFLPTIEKLGIENLVHYMAATHIQYSGLREDIQFPTEYQDFYKENWHKAQHYKVGLGNEGKLLLACKHVCTCRVGEFLAYINSLPSLSVNIKQKNFAEM